jgi:hypothetical protein
MAIIGFLIILIISLGLSYLFVIALNSRGPWGNFWTFFLVLFLGILAVSFWVSPIGPTIGEARWVQLLVTGVILALMLAMAGSLGSRKQKRNAITGKITKAEPYVNLRTRTLFWVLLAVFALSIIVGVYF